jgi:hypothetical protein
MSSCLDAVENPLSTTFTLGRDHAKVYYSLLQATSTRRDWLSR